MYTRNNEPSYVARQEVNLLDGFESVNDDDFSVYTDNSLGTCATIDPANPPAGSYYRADIITANDYYPGGMLMPGRKYSIANTKYRYGFNGKENDNEVKGEGNSQDYGMRIYDPRLVRFLSADPLTKKYPYYSPYQFAGNTPIIATDLDGEEPKVTITNQITGYTKLNVYGDGNVKQAVVATYKAIVQYTDSKGDVTTIAQFNVTRDGWYDMGTDAKGNTILSNRSSDPADGKKVFIALNYKQKYGKETPAFGLTPINSPIDSKYNKTFFKNGKPSDPLDPETVRNKTANGAQLHVGGYYEHPDGEVSLGGTYGCYGVVDPSQISPTTDVSKDDPNNVTLSNDEIRRFGKAIKTANTMQVKEHGSPEKTEVEFQKRDYKKTGIVPAGTPDPCIIN